MSREQYNSIISRAYTKYDLLFDSYYPPFSAPYPKRLTQEEFVAALKQDVNLAKEVGISIEERELSWEEQVRWVMENTDVELENLYIVEEIAKPSTPSRVTIVKTRNETVEVYE